MRIFLETERLLLRRATAGDAPLLFALDSDPEVIRYSDLGGVRPLEFYRETLLPRWLSYYEEYEARGYWIAEEKAAAGEEKAAAGEKASDSFLGWFHFRSARDTPEETELGYRLRRAVWGRGYATEIARELVRRGLADLGATRVVATALTGNQASIRVMEKAGLRFEESYVYKFTDPKTGRTTEHSAVRHGLNKSL